MTDEQPPIADASVPAKPTRQYGEGDPNAKKPTRSRLTARDILATVKELAAKRKNIQPMVSGDQVLRKLATAWLSVVPPKLNRNAVCPGRLPHLARIRWLWSLLPGDVIGTWLRVAGFPDADHTRRAAWMAIENLVVLPDGTLAPAVKELICGRERASESKIPPAEQAAEGVEDGQAG